MIAVKKAGIVLALAAGAALAAWQLAGRRAAGAAEYRLVSIDRGDLESVVTSTGTIEAVSTVQVGTQVSGQIAEIHADFNDRVRKGQLIARIDPVLLQQEVRSAEAALERQEAEERQRSWERGRAETLAAQGVTNESDLTAARYNHSVAQSQLKAARVSLERARRNLAYTEIRSPIDGIVVERNVDVGQTVAASLQAPTLFRIAGDLTHMQILASVDESDIGRIRPDQRVRFTVQAYPDEKFPGKVGQVRLQSKVQENVVNYTVVVAVDNSDGRLLPGMTATVSFLVETVKGALKVPNAALRLRATEEMWAELRRRRGEAAASGAGSGPGQGLLWFLDADGGLNVARVRTGITSGQETQVEGEGIREGMQVIAGITGSTAPSSASPFQSSPRTGGPPHPGP
jgi:HlyD family secretion protein